MGQLKAAALEEVTKDINHRRETSKSPGRDKSKTPEPIDNTLLGAITSRPGLNGKRGSFVLRKEQNDDDMSVSDMDCSDDEAGNKTNIEMNVKIPQMQPRVINRPMRGRIPNQVGPRRVSPGRFKPLGQSGLVAPMDNPSRPRLRQPPPHLIAQQKAAQINNQILNKNSKPGIEDAFDDVENDEEIPENPEKYDNDELQNALEEVVKELNRYKLT